MPHEFNSWRTASKRMLRTLRILSISRRRCVSHRIPSRVLLHPQPYFQHNFRSIVASLCTSSASSNKQSNPLTDFQSYNNEAPKASKTREDINKAYFPGKVYRSTSKNVVMRAMAGNTAITILKTVAWLKTGSSAMLSEAIHSLVDTGNQAILVLGLRQAAGVPDKKHQYGYGRAAYFWSLISALGIFWLGSGVTITHGMQCLINPPSELTLSWEIWGVLACSFLIDGWVLKRAVQELLETKPPNISLYRYIKYIKDPFMMAVLLEDLTACSGVLIAACGIGATHITGNPLWDSLASISIGLLLGGVAVTLIRMNQRFLLGQSVEPGMSFTSSSGTNHIILCRD